MTLSSHDVSSRLHAADRLWHTANTSDCRPGEYEPVVADELPIGPELPHALVGVV